MPGGLDRSPRVNWVERHGGLPSYVERIAKHLLAKGMPMSRAIATAISTSKKWCATGEVHQWPGIQRINMGSRAEACKAVAEWEALKARARASRGGARNMSYTSSPCSNCGQSPGNAIAPVVNLAGPPTDVRRRMAKQGTAMPDGSFPIGSVTDLRKAIQAFGRAPESKRGAVKAHIRKRARALNASNLIPDDWK